MKASLRHVVGDSMKFGAFMLTVMIFLDYVAIKGIPESANLEGKVAIITGMLWH
jgi:hypothetical protein